MRPRALILALGLVVVTSLLAGAAEPEASSIPDADPPTARPVLGPALAMPTGRIPRVDTERRPDATVEKRGVRMDTWVPSEPVASGEWLPAVVRVTNTSDRTILTDGDTKRWPYRLPLSTVLDLTGLFDAGHEQRGLARRFKDRFLDSQTIARLIMEQQPRRGDEFPDYGIRPRLRPGESFDLPVVTVPRYVWRDQPLPSGMASIDTTSCFEWARGGARARTCLESSAPVRIAGTNVEYPGAAEIADAALEDPGFRAWVESRRPRAAFGINVRGIFPTDEWPHEDDPTFADLGYAGGPAPVEDITIWAGAMGPRSGSRTVHVDPWLAAVIGPDAGDPAPTTSPDGTEGASLVPALISVAVSLPALLWPDAPLPASLAEFVPAAREQLWAQAIDGLRLPLHLRFLEARCNSDGGVALVFEEIGRPFFATTYAYAVRGSMPTSPDDGWGGGYGMTSVLDDPEFIHLLGDDTTACP